MRTRTLLFLCLLVLSPWVASADPPPTDGQTIYVGTLLPKLRETTREQPEAKTAPLYRRVLALQQSFAHTTLTREEFLEYYHSTLRALATEGVDGKGFIAATASWYLAFRPDWRTVKNGILHAGPEGTNDLTPPLKPNQIELALHAVATDASEVTRKGVGLAQQFAAALEVTLVNLVLGHVLPTILEPPRMFAERALLIAIYHKALEVLSAHPEPLLKFCEGTARLYRSYRPTAEELETTALSIRVLFANDLWPGIEVVPNHPMDRFDPLPRVRFLRLHAELEPTGESLEQYAQFVLLFQKWLQQWAAFYRDAPGYQYQVYHHYQHRFHTWHASAVPQWKLLVDALTGATVRGRFTGFSPPAVTGDTVAISQRIGQLLEQAGFARPSVASYLAHELRRAGDVASFRVLYAALIHKREPHDLDTANAIAREHLVTLRDLHAPTEFIRELFGGVRADAGALASVVGVPDYFVVLAADALEHHHWEDPLESEAFWKQHLPDFFRADPSVQHVVDLLRAMRDRPVPEARATIEATAFARLATFPEARARGECVALLGYRIGAGSDTARRSIKFVEPTQREQLRRGLWEQSSACRERFFPGLEPSVFWATIFRELIAEAGLRHDRTPLRLLILLEDIKSAEGGAILAEAYPRSQYGVGQPRLHRLALALVQSQVNGFVANAPTHTTSRSGAPVLATLSAEDWEFVQTGADAGAPPPAACETALAPESPAAAASRSRWSWLTGS